MTEALGVAQWEDTCRVYPGQPRGHLSPSIQALFLFVDKQLDRNLKKKKKNTFHNQLIKETLLWMFTIFQLSPKSYWLISKTGRDALQWLLQPHTVSSCLLFTVSSGTADTRALDNHGHGTQRGVLEVHLLVLRHLTLSLHLTFLSWEK